MNTWRHGWCLTAAWMLAACTFAPTPVTFTAPNTTDFAAIVTNATRGAVGIRKPTGARARVTVEGSGVYLGDGYVLTANHTISSSSYRGPDPPNYSRISVVSNTLQDVDATLVGVNTFLDVALYRIAPDAIPDGLVAHRWAATEALPGERVFTVGYPLGWGPAVSYGVVGNPDTFLRTVDSRLVQMDLAVCRGNSGGGVFNARGEIVGMVHAMIGAGAASGDRCGSLAFAVPASLIRRVMPDMKQGAPFAFSTLGLQLDFVKRHHQWCVVVAHVTGPARAGVPARTGGLRRGDILLAIDRRRITSAGQLKTYLMEHTRPSQPVDMRVLRDNREQVIRVILGQAREGTP